MSRWLTLEEYLEEFVDENTQPTNEGTRLLVTDCQAKSLGYFLIDGLTGFVECARLERKGDIELSESEGESNTSDEAEFIN
jgi:hypothetical protein